MADKKQMTLGDLAAKFTELAKERGADTTVSFSVKDSYSVYGVDMKPSWRPSDRFWEGTLTTERGSHLNPKAHTQIKFYLSDQQDPDTGQIKFGNIRYLKG